MVETVRAAYRGGNFNNGANAGVFALNLNNAPSNVNYNIGFRACKVSGFLPDGQDVCSPERSAWLLWNHDPCRKAKNKKELASSVEIERDACLHQNHMAKTYKNLYEKICAFENIHDAYLRARRSKRYKPDVLKFSARLEENLINIQNHLIHRSYRPGRYRYFTVYEPKERLIAALPFFDRVVHHALCNIIEPIFERSMIYDSYACRVGKGALKGVNRTTQFMRTVRRQHGNVYCLKADIKKFFPSIDHEVLKKIIRKRIACTDTLHLMDSIIDSSGDGRGLPIGSLTSQLWANLYLNELDHYTKECLGAKHYIRYMDDVVILHQDKKVLGVILEEMRLFLEGRLRLTLNGKTQIFPVGPRCVDFLGYRIWPDYRLLRKRNVKRNKRKFKKFSEMYSCGMMNLHDTRPAIMSWIGHAVHADTYRLRCKVLNGLNFARKNVLRKGKERL